MTTQIHKTIKQKKSTTANQLTTEKFIELLTLSYEDLIQGNLVINLTLNRITVRESSHITNQLSAHWDYSNRNTQFNQDPQVAKKQIEQLTKSVIQSITKTQHQLLGFNIDMSELTKAAKSLENIIPVFNLDNLKNKEWHIFNNKEELIHIALYFIEKAKNKHLKMHFANQAVKIIISPIIVISENDIF